MKDMFSKLAYSVFKQSIQDYHQFDSVDQPINNPFPKEKFEHLLINTIKLMIILNTLFENGIG